MKILIIEDNPLHIKAAKKQLSEHELTICTSYAEAEMELCGWTRSRNVSDLIAKKLDFDAVLTDLFLPSSVKGTELEHATQEERAALPEVPYGLVFAMFALRKGIPVAIVSDMSHHKNPLCWAMDLIGGHYALGGVKFFTSELLIREDEERNEIKCWDKALQYLMKD
ncbi:MAG: response regulator [Candidatus Peribacteria bacterium]|jgi:CheY-like chemotaxis protein|nr:response regulator [Candidatus Peribacteria bacterium]